MNKKRDQSVTCAEGDGITVAEVLRRERRLIQCKRQQRKSHQHTASVGSGQPQSPKAPEQATEQPTTLESEQNQNWQQNLLGLAFSGGGIRSATFNLGLLQALARLGLLRYVDYLSTVSGGGYIGGWFSALLRKHGRLQRVAEEVLAPARQELGLEPYPIRYLRRFSNYLTPRLGILGLDLWTAAATYLRNLVLNWMMLIPIICAVLMLPYLLAGLGAFVFSGSDALLKDYSLHVFLSLALIMVVVAAVFVGKQLAALHHARGQALSRLGASRTAPGHGASPPVGSPEGEQTSTDSPGLEPAAADAVAVSAGDDSANPSSGWGFKGVAVSILMPLVLACIFALFATLHATQSINDGNGVFVHLSMGYEVLTIVCGTLLIYALFWLVAKTSYRRCQVYHLRRRNPAGDVPLGVPKTTFGLWCSALVSLGTSAVLMGLVLLGLIHWLLGLNSWLLGLIMGPPAFFLWVFLLGTLHKGLARGWLCEQDREWFGRMSGFFLMSAVAWAGLFGFAALGPFVIRMVSIEFNSSVLLAWGGTTLGTLLAGRRAPGSGLGQGAKKAAVVIGPYLFILGLVGLLAYAMQEAGLWMAALHNDDAAARIHDINHIFNNSAIYGQSYLSHLWLSYVQLIEIIPALPLNVLLIAGLLLLALIFSYFVDINDFSLQNFYANRLARAYLGAAQNNDERMTTAIDFTGFNYGDDVPLHGVECVSRSGEFECAGHDGPYHLVNAALNLAASKELAWQERKAGSFVFSPLFCGYTLGTFQDEQAESKALVGAYCRAVDLRTRESADPLTLGAAVATSGAAASPNMGFRTTAAHAFLLTFFNVRLGRWISNPLYENGTNLSSPRWAHTVLLAELFAATARDRKYVYVSDGGHFDNLGIYELIRRQCRFIIASDAGADPQYEYADLGNVIRKVRADFGVEIEIDTRDICLDDTGYSRSHCALGIIRYAPGKVGYLLYIKASLSGNESIDILNYKKQFADFPHQTTADQFFSESQFESYRKLGQTIGTEVFEQAVADTNFTASADNDDAGGVNDDDEGGTLSVDYLFSILRSQWYPSTPVKSQNFTRNSQRYHELMQQLRSDPHLGFLMKQIYPEWRRTAHPPFRGFDLSGTVDDMNEIPYTDEASFRAAFAFCNSLIQLMEDVYLDLQLEQFHDYPDNRGWINLFKHWSWSGMVRLTWSVSAATFGHRFQLFCDRYLGLKVGKVDVSSFTIDEYVKAQKGVFIQDRTFMFNFYEQEQIDKVLECIEDTPEGAVQIHQLELAVKKHDEHDGDLFRFSYGYAISNNMEIISFRVQDHLRKMGLARRGLRCVLRDLRKSTKLQIAKLTGNKLIHKKKRTISTLDDVKTHFMDQYDFSRSSIDRFERLLASVERELDDSPQDDDAPNASKSDAE